MFKRGYISITLLMGLAVVSVIQAGYYEPDFFPIGLSGLEKTGDQPYDHVNNCPYSNTERPVRWTWADESDLINALGVNCIGSEDCYQKYLIDFSATPSQNNYLHQVCAQASPNPVYLITASYYSTPQWYEYGPTENDSTPKSSSLKHIRPSTFFRSPHRPLYGGYGSARFHPDTSIGGWYPFGTTSDANWDDFDGDDRWRAMADEAVTRFQTHFTSNPGEAQYIWGYNLITEDPAMCRGTGFNPPWHGVWAAVDRVFTGHNSGKFSLPLASHTGIRGAEGGTRRMFIAKGGTSSLIEGEHNIFQWLPDLDAFVIYRDVVRAGYNYGDQRIFDLLLGYEKDAAYFKQYGSSYLVTGQNQKRRWIASMCLSWRVENSNTPESPSFARFRRPCPPEIRCMTYLALSRGAKGVLYHYWTGGTTYGYKTGAIDSIVGVDTFWHYDPRNNQEPYMAIPTSYSSAWTRGIGLRDHEGYPFGYWDNRNASWYSSNPTRHRLNNGNSGSWEHTYWHDHNWDTTYNYLANTLIPEIKRLTPWLVNLTWINAYSRNRHNESQFEPSCQYIKVFNTSPIKFPPEYVYIDIGFFTDDEDRDYYMPVNREKIATNTSYPIKIIFDEIKARKKSGVIWLTDLSDTTVFAVPSGSYQVTMWYAPGEGRLYGVGWDFGAPKDPKLGVAWVPLKGSQNGPMSPLRDNDPEDPDPCPWPYTANLAWYFYSGSWEFEGYNVYRRKVPNDYDNFWSNCSDPHEYQKSCHDDSVYWTGEVGNWYLNAYVRRDEGTPQVVLTSNGVTKVCPGEPPEDTSDGCPTLYSYWKYLGVTGIYMFRQENTILPHSEHGDSIGLDLLALNYPIPDFNGHYYLNISEDHNETSYLDQIKLWVVDHSEESKVGTTADGEILVYSDVAFPYTCYDQNHVNHRGKMLDPTQAFVGNDGDYLQFSFPDYGWESKALLVGMKAPPGAESAPAPKNYLGRGSSWDGDSSWIPEGEAYARHNPSEWLIDVSDASTCCFRLECEGDSASINYVHLVKLDTNFTITEAALDSAVHYDDENNGSVKTGYVAYADTFSVTISLDEQLSLRFDQVDTSTTYPVRNFVLQSRGLYVSGYGGGGQHSSGEAPLRFGLEVRQIKPLGRTAHINYSVPHLTQVKIAIYDVSGRIVKKLVDNEVAPGKHSFEWQGTDYANRKVASGTYFIKMTATKPDAEDHKETTKIVVLD